MNNIGQTPTTFEILNTNHAIWDEIFRDCAAAEHSIDLEQYILRDEIGKRLITLFIEKAAAGIKIRLLLDRIDSRSIMNSPLIEKLKSLGAEVYFYNRISILNLPFPATWFPRNHSKVTVIDNRIAYVGGACFADFMEHWQDLHVRVTGELVQDIVFAWEERRERKIKFLRQSADGKIFRYVVASPRWVRNPVYEEFLAYIRSAEKFILMATPYFLPPYRLRRELRKAAARGVNVKVIMSDETDVPLAVRTAQSYFPRLLKKGLRIFLYQGTVFHAKYMIVDDRWATLGSINIDYLSLLRNREANIIIRDKDLIERLRKNFENDLSRSEQVLPGFWENLPPGSRLCGYMGRLVKKFL